MMGRLLQETSGSECWQRQLLHCGVYDDERRAFPVMHSNSLMLWIPHECRFGLRLLNHTIYCLWVSSLDNHLPSTLQKHAKRIGSYANKIWSKFFSEVLDKWYRAGADLQTSKEPMPERRPFMSSSILSLFLMVMHQRDTPVLQDDWVDSTLEWWKGYVKTLGMYPGNLNISMRS